MLFKSLFRCARQATSTNLGAGSQMQQQTRAYLAAVLNEYGKSLDLENKTEPLKPGDNELLVQVDTAAINSVDAQIIRGLHTRRPKVPFVPGYELAGEVIEVGAKVREFHRGDRVLGIKTWTQGAFAEHCIVNAHAAHHIPHSMSYETAACMPVAYGTAWLALAKVGRIKQNDFVLVLSSQGSSGIACIDLALNVYKCGRVIAGAENEEKCALVRPMGVLSTVEYTDENLPKIVRKITNGRGCDLIIDTVGGFWFDLALKSLRPGGHLITTGFSSHQVPMLTLSDLIKYRATISGVRLSGIAEDDPDEFHEIIDLIIDWREQGYFQKVNDAMDFIEKERPFGKAVLVCRK